MAKDPIVIDLIHCEYIGAWKNKYKAGEHGGRRPVISEVADSKIKSLLPMLKEKKAYPHDLQPKRHIKRYTNPKGQEFIFIKPTEDMNLAYEHTAMAEVIGGESEEIQSLREKNNHLKKKNRKLKRQNKKLKQEKEEQSKHEDSGKSFSDVPCPKCGESFKPQQWSQRNGVCPNCKNRNHKYS